MVLHLQFHFYRGLNIEEQIDGIAEADILGAGAYIESQLHFPFTGVTGIQLYDGVLQFQSRQPGSQRAVFIHDHLQKAVLHLADAQGVFFLHPGRRAGTVQDGKGIWAFHFEARRDLSLVVDLDQKTFPAFLQKFCFGRSGFHFHPCRRIDIDGRQTVGVQNALDGDDRIFVERPLAQCLQPAGGFLGQRITDVGQRLADAFGLSEERLGFDAGDQRGVQFYEVPADLAVQHKWKE